MSSKAMEFSFYGVNISVMGCEELLQDFSFFQIQDSPQQVHFTVRLKDKTSEVLPMDWRKISRNVAKTRMCLVYQLANLRICEYSAQTLVVLESTESAVCYSSNRTEAYQAIYYLILSRVGEELDLRGLHRLHAVAIQEGGLAKCWPMDSGKGKTTKALQALLETKYQIFGDEIILTDGSKIYPFPIQLSLREDVFQKYGLDLKNIQSIDRLGSGRKYLLRIPSERVAQASGNFVIFPENFLFPINFLLGLGLPQMREYLIRPGQVLRLTKIFILRVICLVKLISKIQR